MQIHTYRTTIDFDNETMAILKQLAFEEKSPMSRVVRKAVVDYSRARKRQRSPTQIVREIRELAEKANKRSKVRKGLTDLLVEERDKRYHAGGYL